MEGFSELLRGPRRDILKFLVESLEYKDLKDFCEGEKISRVLEVGVGNDLSILHAFSNVRNANGSNRFQQGQLVGIDLQRSWATNTSNLLLRGGLSVQELARKIDLSPSEVPFDLVIANAVISQGALLKPDYDDIVRSYMKLQHDVLSIAAAMTSCLDANGSKLFLAATYTEESLIPLPLRYFRDTLGHQIISFQESKADNLDVYLDNGLMWKSDKVANILLSRASSTGPMIDFTFTHRT